MSQKEERERPEKLFEAIRAENFPKLGVKKNRRSGPGSTESHNKINPKRSTPRHTTIKMTKIKERILNTAREEGTLTRWSVDSLAGASQVIHIFKAMKGKKKLTTKHTLSREVSNMPE